MALDSVNEHYEKFDVSWLQCSERLILTTLRKIEASSLTFTVKGLRLPRDGISVDLRNFIALEMVSTIGYIAPTPFGSLPLLAAAHNSSIVFDPPVVESSVTTLSVQLTLSVALKLLDGVSFYLPGIVIGSATPAFTVTGENVELNGDPLYSTPQFVSAWDSTLEILNFTVKAENITAQTLLEFTLTNKVDLPASGFPQLVEYTVAGAATPSSLLEADGSISKMLPTFSVFAADGDIFRHAFHHVQAVGITEADVAYDIDEITENVGIKFHVKTSNFIAEGDRLSIYTPVLKSTTGVLGDIVVETTGNYARDSFMSYFNATYNTGTQVFDLVCNYQKRDLVPFLDFSVFVAPDQGFQILANGTVDNKHTINGLITSIGTIASKEIPYTPNDVMGVDISNVTFVNCAQFSACQVEFDLVLNATVTPDDMFALSHPNLMMIPHQSLDIPLTADQEDIDALLAREETERNSGEIQSQNSLASSDDWIVQWRGKDNMPQVTFSSEVLLTVNGSTGIDKEDMSKYASYVYGDTDYYSQTVNTTLPLHNVSGRFGITTSPPRVSLVYMTALYCMFASRRMCLCWQELTMSIHCAFC